MRRIAAAVVASTLVLVPVAVHAQEPSDNLPPNAEPDSATVTAGQSVTIQVLANDTDDGRVAPLEVVGAQGPDGTSYDSDSVLFQSAVTDAGTVTIGYEVSDGELTASSTVTVSITPVRRALSLSAPPVVVALHRFTLRGTVTPHRSIRVVLQRRLGRSAWRNVARTTSDAAGRFDFDERLARLGRVRYRAGNGGVWSPVVSRRIEVKSDVSVSGPLTRGDVRWSYRPGCPVTPSGLRRIRVTHITYDGRVRRGAVVMSAGAVPAVRAMFVRALADRFPFRRLAPADRFYADGHRTPTQSDLAAMRADNTSAFNCRTVTGNPYKLSQHSYGNAIDINTVRNPYVTASRVYPSFARPFLHRANRRDGMLFGDGVVARTFRARGWLWGARWAHPDYQHFSANGG